MAGFSYPEVGGTRDEQGLPAGYHHLRYRTRVGRGRAVFEAAGDAVLGFGMHRAVGVRVRSDAARAVPGARVEVALGCGPVRVVAPCEVVWAVEGPERIGFAYGTLPGHPERGEEAFLVELGEGDEVWFSVTAFSRPARWFTRLAGPLVPVFQKAYVRRCGRVLTSRWGGGG